MSMNVKQESKDEPLSYDKINVEVYEIKENNVVEQDKKFELKKEDSDQDWTWKRKKYNSDGGYFDHA